jgi:hypothetical protein
MISKRETAERRDASSASDPDRAAAEDPGLRRRAIEALRAACRRVRDDVAASGWLLTDEPPAPAAGGLIVRFAMQRDGAVASECGFSIGPGRAVAFGRPAHRAVSGVLDAMGEAEFHRLIEAWAREVQAGIGHRWRYEAKLRGQGR